MHFDVNEIRRALEIFGRAQPDGRDSCGWDFYLQSYRMSSSKKSVRFDVPLLGEVSVVQSDGKGSETDSKYSLVFEVASPAFDGSEDHVRYFKMEGYVDSYDDIVWDGGFSEVRPKEKLVVSYEYV
jgi:hypothetical protein